MSFKPAVGVVYLPDLLRRHVWVEDQLPAILASRGLALEPQEASSFSPPTELVVVCSSILVKAMACFRGWLSEAEVLRVIVSFHEELELWNDREVRELCQLEIDEALGSLTPTEVLVVRSREYVFVHAAACALDGKAVLLPGLSRAGKTTLAQALARRGLTFYSDEYAVLDPNGLLHPFARDLAVRADPSQARGRRISPRELGYQMADQPAKVVLGCFLQYRSDGRLDVQQISPGEAVLSLFDNTLAARMMPRRSLRMFAQITKSMQLYAGERGEAELTADWIACLLHRRAPG